MSVHITPDLLADPDLYSLSHARIGFHSHLNESAVNLTATAGAEGFPAQSMTNPATWERYKLSLSPPTITIVNSFGGMSFDYIAIGSHSLAGCTIHIHSSSDGITWDEIVAPTSIVDNNAIMFMFLPEFKSQCRLTITGVVSEFVSPKTIGHIKIGQLLKMHRPIYGGHSPITLSLNNVTKPAVSEKGQWLGASIQRRGMKTKFSWKNIDPAWYRTYFQSFVDSEPTANPFFIAWSPFKHSDEVGYCLASSDIKPTNSGTRNYMDVSLSVDGFSDV